MNQSTPLATKKSKVKKIIIPVVILISTFFISQVIINNPPESNRGSGEIAAKITVETLPLVPQRYTIMLNSFGTVQPRTQSVLVAQVSGEINEISQQFRNGGFFEKGDVLVQLDDRDHRAEVNLNQANLLSAKQALLEEQARAKQALIDWQRLGNGAQASALVLREPQLAAAQAQVLSAQANLEKAQLQLERTNIVAPFAGRILTKHVDLGRVVASNTQLADIYAIDYVEIRLPIKNKDLSFMALPEEYRDSNKTVQGTMVQLTSTLIGQQQWQGEIVRTEGAVDENSQQLYVVAQIDNPYDVSNNKVAPIKIGQYVNAEITGRTIEKALVIPNSAIYQGSYVYTVENIEDKNVLKRKDINIRWQNNEDALIEAGLTFGEKLVLTPLGQVSSGTPVKLAGETTVRGQKSNRGDKKEEGRLNKKKNNVDKAPYVENN
ncbi:efflux RND transporter periplasmic adaptor subunit [Colwellia sp. E150_009]